MKSEEDRESCLSGDAVNDNSLTLGFKMGNRNEKREWNMKEENFPSFLAFA